MARKAVISCVKPRLYVGNLSAASSIRVLKLFRVKRVVTVIKDRLLHSAPDKSFYRKLGIEQKVFPIFDDAFNVKSKKAAVSKDLLPWIMEAEKENLPILVHCVAGASRSTSLVITYLMWKYKMSFEEAYLTVCDEHPLTNPNPYVLSSFLACINEKLPAWYEKTYPLYNA